MNDLYDENSIRYQEPTNLIKIFADTTIQEFNFIGNFLQSTCPMNLISFARDVSKFELSGIQKSTFNKVIIRDNTFDNIFLTLFDM
jgi:hypothetical protein